MTMNPTVRHHRSRGAGAVLRCAALIALGLGLSDARAAGGSADGFLRPAAAFDRANVGDPTALARVKAVGNLSGGACCVTGWFEYDFRPQATGWYQLIVHGNGGGVEFLIDPGKTDAGHAPAQFYEGSGRSEPTDKIGNVWLTAGTHTVRLQRHYWTGFPAITAVELRKSGAALSENFAVVSESDNRIFRRNECGALEILSGGRTAPARLQAWGANRANRYVPLEIVLPASAGLVRQSLPLLCADEGQRSVVFGENNHTFDGRDVRGFHYEVVDTHGAARLASSHPAGLVLDIDCAAREPDFAAGGTRVVSRTFGAYRESGDTGWTRYQRAPELARRALAEPSWFAYTLEGLAPQQRYRIDVEYPDDALRTFAVALREANPLNYPVATGIDSGGEYRLSHAMQNLAMTVWPRGPAPRLLFAPTHDNMRAACSRIRVYRADAPEPLPGIEGLGAGHRQFLSWYEEGSNYPSLFGPADQGPLGLRTAAERWAEAVTAVGGSTLMPTVVIYSFALYPSSHNVAFSTPNQDVLRRLLLVAEKYRLKVVPELHPRADELALGRSDPRQAPPNVLISREGRSNFFGADGKSRSYPPYFNPLSAENQKWYIAMIGELADRYKDSPAFDGVSLRFMHWANPALNNLVSLDWGYDDDTVASFKRETGSAVPLGRADDPRRFADRHAWLTTQGREAWIDWRCRKIADLHKRVRDRIRQARPDLKLYVNVFANDEAHAPAYSAQSGRNMVARLREAGIDPGLLTALDGVVLLNAAYSYGRRESEGIFQGARDSLLDPAALNALRKPGDGGRFLSSSRYLEATGVVVPPPRLGFPAATRETWMSAVANPPARFPLERYAIELAETDAFVLGDGGNGYTFGPSVVREFMREFRMLPAQSFTARADAVDPVTVRTLETPGDHLFYAINRAAYPVRLAVDLSRPARVTRLSGGAELPTAGGRLELELKPYELLAARTDADVRITHISATPPTDERRRVERQLDWVRRLSMSSGLASLIGRGPDAAERRQLADAVQSAGSALERGWLWRAQSILEHSSLLVIYRRTGCYPPGLLSGKEFADDCSN